MLEINSMWLKELKCGKFVSHGAMWNLVGASSTYSPHSCASSLAVSSNLVSIDFFLLEMSIPALNKSSLAFFEVEAHHYDTHNQPLPAVRSISQLASESHLMPANQVVKCASVLGPLRDGWGLGGISPVHSSFFVAHKVEF